MGGSSLRHNLTVSRSCCWTPGRSQRGSHQKTLRDVCIPVSFRAGCAPLGCGTWSFSVCVDCLSTQPWDNHGAGWFGLWWFLCAGELSVLFQVTSWPFPQLLPIPKVLFRADLEESILFPPILLPYIPYLQLWLLKVVLLPPSSVTPCHGERTMPQQDEKPCSRASYCRAKTQLQARPRICPTFPSWPSCT